MSIKRQNNINPKLMSIQGINSFAAFNSSSRAYMGASHISQRLVLLEGDEKRIQTGIEKELGKYTFSIRMPENGRIISVVPRYPKGIDVDSLNFNPETTVVYENDETKEIDCFNIPYHSSYHTSFGYENKRREENIEKIRPDSYITKDTIFADSPAITENGGYKFGLTLNTALGSLPGCSEDGFVVSEEALEKLKFKIFETRTVEFGSSSFPLNLYSGDHKIYKPMPEIGDYIREDGLLMMLRKYDSKLYPVTMSIYDTMEPDHMFDRGVYVKGPNGRIVDVKVIRNNNDRKLMPQSMCKQLDKYADALVHYHMEIIRIYNALKMKWKKLHGDRKMRISRKFHSLIKKSFVITNHDKNKHRQALELSYRKEPVDEYRIEFTIEYIATPTIGFKISCLQGGFDCKVISYI